MEQRVLIGMSGGVDSSVAAFLMQQQGYVCVGATMRLYDDPRTEVCSGRRDVEDARAVAQRLGICHFALDFQAEFADKVIGDFIAGYETGLTPNPCIQCNRHLKFRALLDKAKALGCQGVVSGHYARIRRDEATGRYLLLRAADKGKDQTYFLASLDQTQMACIHFPLGELTKEQVRVIAEENGFLNARKRDSQDICFVPDGDYVAFMKRWTGKDYPGGDYLDQNGKVLGRHQGAVCYTIGQRKGLGIALGAPAYVCAKDMQSNTVTLGPNEALYANALEADDWNFFPFPALTGPMTVTAKTRHSQREQSATVYPGENGTATVVFDQPLRAITPGQAVVLYDGELVVGGGTIRRAMNI